MSKYGATCYQLQIFMETIWLYLFIRPRTDSVAKRFRKLASHKVAGTPHRNDLVLKGRRNSKNLPRAPNLNTAVRAQLDTRAVAQSGTLLFRGLEIRQLWRVQTHHQCGARRIPFGATGICRSLLPWRRYRITPPPSFGLKFFLPSSRNRAKVVAEEEQEGEKGTGRMTEKGQPMGIATNNHIPSHMTLDNGPWTPDLSNTPASTQNPKQTPPRKPFIHNARQGISKTGAFALVCQTSPFAPFPLWNQFMVFLRYFAVFCIKFFSAHFPCTIRILQNHDNSFS